MTDLYDKTNDEFEDFDKAPPSEKAEELAAFKEFNPADYDQYRFKEEV